MKKGLLITSVLSIAMLASITAGATYALFMVEDERNIAITAGEVAVSAVVDQTTLRTYSLGEEQVSGFANGGTATFDEASNLALNLLTPGDAAEFVVRIDNASTIRVKYRISVLIEGELAGVLQTKALVNGEEKTLLDGKPTQYVTVEMGEDIPDVPVRVELPADALREWCGKSASISVKVEVVQANAPEVDTWDGTADYDWFFADPTAEEFSLDSAEALAGLADLVDGNLPVALETEEETPEYTFDGKVFYLNCDIDLGIKDEEGEYVSFDPIGSYRFEKAFSGVLDGQGHTIRNMYQNTWELNNGYYYEDCGLGLFGALTGATIRNLVMEEAHVSGESAICGIVTAYAENTTFENITVKESDCADYQYYSGGVVGWASGACVFDGITMEESAIVAAQWGDFDNSTGGIIGGCGGSAEITIKNSVVACRIDAYNDVTSSYQWYAYRRCGMLIGNTGKTTTTEEGGTVAAAPQLTCENVQVIYGDWANYTYCEFAGTSWPYCRVQAGVSSSAYSNPRYGHPVDAEGNTVVDDNHVHNEGEDHHILCEFDQLYGGGQGVYGAKTHEGVEVIYNNHK